MLRTLQDEGKLTELMMLQEELKTFPLGDVWMEYCRQCGVAADQSWFEEVKKYEADVLSKR
jgi:L-rhamnose isomerase